MRLANRLTNGGSGNPMTAEGNQVVSARTGSSRNTSMRLSLMLPPAAAAASLPFRSREASASFHLLPLAVDDVYTSSSPPLQPSSHQMVTLSHTFSRPIMSTSRITVLRHRHEKKEPQIFTITESFLIHQVITGNHSTDSGCTVSAAAQSTSGAQCTCVRFLPFDVFDL